MSVHNEEKPFPAREGMTRAVTHAAGSIFPVPRTRGDEPNPTKDRLKALDRSPHARG